MLTCSAVSGGVEGSSAAARSATVRATRRTPPRPRPRQPAGAERPLEQAGRRPVERGRLVEPPRAGRRWRPRRGRGRRRAAATRAATARLGSPVTLASRSSTSGRPTRRGGRSGRSAARTPAGRSAAGAGRAPAGARAPPSPRAGVLGAHQQEPGRERHLGRGARATRITPSSSGWRSWSSTGVELAHLVEEQQAAVGERHLAGPWRPTPRRGTRPTPRDAAPGTAGGGPAPGGQGQAGGMDAGGLERLGRGQVGQDPGEPPGQHRLPGARRPDQQVVAAGGGHLEASGPPAGRARRPGQARAAARAPRAATVARATAPGRERRRQVAEPPDRPRRWRPMRPASTAEASGTTTSGDVRASMSGIAPGTGRIDRRGPARPGRPVGEAASGSCSVTTRRPTAMARSSPAPACGGRTAPG